MSMRNNRLIVDTDGGVDDAQALAMLIGNGRPPFAVTTVFGNVGLDLATTNVLAVLATYGADCAVFKGASQALIEPLIDATYVHGEDGLGGAPRPARQRQAETMHAVDFLRQTLSAAAQSGDLVDLLMIGPLTNLALALRVAPSIAAGIGQLIVMGGTMSGRGNVTPAAEFNIFADPEAARIVFSSPIETILVSWEACLGHALSGSEADAIHKALPATAENLFSEALARHLRANAISRGRGDQMLFVDPLAAAVAVAPEIVTSAVSASIDVSLAPGLTRGMTVIDPSGRLGTPMARIIESVDPARLADLYRRSAAYVSR